MAKLTFMNDAWKWVALAGAAIASMAGYYGVQNYPTQTIESPAIVTLKRPANSYLPQDLSVQAPAEQAQQKKENNLEFIVSTEGGWTQEEVEQLSPEVQKYASLIKEYIGIPPWRDGDKIPVNKKAECKGPQPLGGYYDKKERAPYGEILICDFMGANKEIKDHILSYTIAHEMLHSLDIPSTAPFFPDSKNSDDEHFAYVMAVYFTKLTNPASKSALDGQIGAIFSKDKDFMKRLYQKYYEMYEPGNEQLKLSGEEWLNLAKETSKTPEFYDWLESNFNIK